MVGVVKLNGISWLDFEWTSLRVDAGLDARAAEECRASRWAEVLLTHMRFDKGSGDGGGTAKPGERPGTVDACT